MPTLGAGERLALWLPDEMLVDRTEYAIRLAGGVEIAEKDGKVLNVLTLGGTFPMERKAADASVVD